MEKERETKKINKQCLFRGKKQGFSIKSKERKEQKKQKQKQK